MDRRGDRGRGREPAPLQPTIDILKYDVFVPYSFEVGLDAVNFKGEVSRVMLDAVDVGQATAFTTGNGTTQPRGLITAIVAS